MSSTLPSPHPHHQVHHLLPHRSILDLRLDHDCIDVQVHPWVVDAVEVADTVVVGNCYRTHTLSALDVVGLGTALGDDGSSTRVVVEEGRHDLDLVPDLEVGQVHCVVDAMMRHLLDPVGGLWHVVSNLTGPRIDVHKMVLGI